MITVGIFEAKAILGQLVQSAAEGEVVLLTRRGKALAEIRAPADATHPSDVGETIMALRKFRSANRVGRFNIAKLVAEGRR